MEDRACCSARVGQTAPDFPRPVDFPLTTYGRYCVYYLHLLRKTGMSRSKMALKNFQADLWEDFLTLNSYVKLKKKLLLPLPYLVLKALQPISSKFCTIDGGSH